MAVLDEQIVVTQAMQWGLSGLGIATRLGRKSWANPFCAWERYGKMWKDVERYGKMISDSDQR